MKKFRIGNGYDVHKLVEGRDLVLGGVKIPSDLGCLAHSDGDVLIHALCDALLGALALGDIGLHFPDNDNSYKGIDSTLLLKKCMQMVIQRGYSVSNVDTTIALQSPKLRPHIDSMRERLAAVMNIPVEDVSVKATTTERLGFEGRREGVSAYATVLLVEKQ
jgi:2-C-methyl-D-erythritol 2,4-cyclodiphosphate synthase